MPAIAYAGRPFFASAVAALRHGRTNMDVPISVGVILVTGMSLVQTMRAVLTRTSTRRSRCCSFC